MRRWTTRRGRNHAEFGPIGCGADRLGTNIKESSPKSRFLMQVTFTTLSRWLSNDGTAKGKSPKGKSYRVRKIQDESEGKWLRLDRFQTIPEFSLHGISSRIEEKAPNEAGSERTEITVSLHISRCVCTLTPLLNQVLSYSGTTTRRQYIDMSTYYT